MHIYIKSVTWRRAYKTDRIRASIISFICQSEYSFSSLWLTGMCSLRLVSLFCLVFMNLDDVCL